jgi:hypothetical protein
LVVEYHVFEIVRQRVEKVRRRRTVARHRQVHLATDDFVVVANCAGVIEVANAGHEHGGLESIAMRDEVANDR